MWEGPDGRGSYPLARPPVPRSGLVQQHVCRSKPGIETHGRTAAEHDNCLARRNYRLKCNFRSSKAGLADLVVVLTLLAFAIPSVHDSLQGPWRQLPGKLVARRDFFEDLRLATRPVARAPLDAPSPVRSADTLCHTAGGGPKTSTNADQTHRTCKFENCCPLDLMLQYCYFSI